EAFDLAAEEAAAERAVGDEADAELAAGGEDAVFRIAAPQRVLALQRRDRMDLAGAAHGLDARFGEAEIADLSFLHELRHRADRVLDRRLWIDAVLVIEIDHVDAEALQAALARLPHVVRPAADAAHHVVLWITHDAELGRQRHFLAAPLDR